MAAFQQKKEGTVKGYKAILLGAALVMTLVYPVVNGQAPKPAAGSSATIERGRYVVEIGGCNDCHTSGYANAGGKAAEADRLKGDTLGYRGPWGTTYPTNLRLSIGSLTEDAWVKRAKTLNTRPPMPWFNIQAMTETDQRALYQYVKSLGSGGTKSPEFVPPDKTPNQPYIQWPGVK
jgi:mono/diheme cytochrome c family protein